ncbi:hypothetical protein BGX33_002182, partial [Mortierella sp. NVP41]
MGKRRRSRSPAGNQSQVSSPKRRQTNTPQPTPLAPRNIYPPRQTRAQAQSSANTPHPTSLAPRSIDPSRKTQAQVQTSAGTSATTSTTTATTSTTTTFATAATSATDNNKTTKTVEAARSFKFTSASSNPRSSAHKANAPRVSAPSPSGALSAASAVVKAVPKKRARKPKIRRNTEVAKMVSAQGDDEYESESENDQPDDDDDNASVSGSEGSVSEMILQTAKAAKKNKLKAKAEEKYRLAAKELVYDTFMLLHQETEPQQGASQDSHLAALNAVRQREEELVANLQSSSNCLADNTRDAYRIIFEDYKKFCNANYSSETFKRYEVNPRKALAYLRYLYAQRTPKHIGPTPTVRRIFLDRETVKANRVPIEGALETVDLARYVDAEETAGKVSCRADGGRTIYTPYSYSKIEHGYAALNTLQKLQQARSAEPNTAQPLATYKLIEDSMKGYAKSLVCDMPMFVD